MPLKYAMIAMLVELAMDLVKITNSVTSKATPDHDTASSMLDSGNHTCRTHALTLSASYKYSAVGPKNISDFDSLVHKTDFHYSNVQFLCFLAQASLFLLFCTLNNGFFAAILPVRPASRNLL